MAATYLTTLGASTRVYLLPFHNFTGTSTPNTAGTPRNPTQTDDVNAGYARGSLWENYPATFECVYAGANAAIWIEQIFPVIIFESAAP